MAVCFHFCFLLLFVCRSSVTAEEEQMFDGNQMLETTARMEAKMAELEENVSSILEQFREKMEEEFRTQNGNIKRKDELLKEIVLSILENRIEEIDEEFNKQNGTLKTLIADFNDVRDDVRNATADLKNVAESITDRPKVAFNAYTTASGTYPYNKAVIFPNVLLNEGRGYNSSTGEFTAPVSGLYQFHAHVCQLNHYHMVVSIVHGYKTLATSTVFESESSGCSSVSAPALINEGEIVCIKSSHYNSRLYADTKYRSPSFSGFLVNE